MPSRNEVIKSVLVFMEGHGRILTEKEYSTYPETPVSFRFLHRNFGSWKRVIGRCATLFPDRVAALKSGGAVNQEVEKGPLSEGTLTALQALAMLKAAKSEVPNEEE